MSINNIIEDIVNDYKHNLAIDYSKIYADIFNFFEKEDVIVFGGAALNLLLPTSKKIYNNNSIYDIDVLTYKPIVLGKKLVDYLHKKGHKYIQFSRSPVEKVFNVKITFRNIIDIGYIDKDIYDKLVILFNQDKKKFGYDFKYKIAPQVYLMFALYRELSIPETSLYRWTKIFSRYELFLDTFKKNNIQEEVLNYSKNNNTKLYEDIFDIIVKEECVISGVKGFQYLSQNKFSCDNNDLYNKLIISAIKPNNIIIKLKSIIKSNNLVVIEHKYNTTKMPCYHSIMRGNFEILKIIDNSNNCCSYVEIKHIKVGTFVTIMTHLLYDLMNNIKLKDYYIQLFNNFLYFYTKNKKIITVEKFLNTSCYGIVQNIDIMRIKHWNKSENENIILKTID